MPLESRGLLLGRNRWPLRRNGEVAQPNHRVGNLRYLGQWSRLQIAKDASFVTNKYQYPAWSRRHSQQATRTQVNMSCVVGNLHYGYLKSRHSRLDMFRVWIFRLSPISAAFLHLAYALVGYTISHLLLSFHFWISIFPTPKLVFGFRTSHIFCDEWKKCSKRIRYLRIELRVPFSYTIPYFHTAFNATD